MTNGPTAPNWSKGAIVAVDPDNPLASIIVFQYNPLNVRRDLQPKISGGGAPQEAMRLGGAPEETISLEIDIDAADQLETEDPDARLLGIYPHLSALEMLIYPKTRRVAENTRLLQQGVLEIVPPEAPPTFLVWGKQRVLPVRVMSLGFTEQMYDSNLNPIRAQASLSLRVLTYNDLSPDHSSYGVFVAHQIAKEGMAVKGSVRSATGLPSGVPGLS